MACALGLVFLQCAASAHKLVVFASVDGRTVRGEAYFHGGSAAQGAEVRVLDPQGNELAKTTTDSEGLFAFEPPVRCALKLVVTTGEGHSAEFTVPADELPDALPGATNPAQQAARQPGQSNPPSATGTGQPATPLPETEGIASPETLAWEVAQLRKQVQALRQEVFHYEQKVRWHDVLGGIGYILGLSGAAFYLLGAKRRERNTHDQPPAG